MIFKEKYRMFWFFIPTLMLLNLEDKNHYSKTRKWSLSPAKKKYTTIERKALVVIYACKKFHYYLLGYWIVFHTNHDSLKYLVNKSDLSRG